MQKLSYLICFCSVECGRVTVSLCGGGRLNTDLANLLLNGNYLLARRVRVKCGKDRLLLLIAVPGVSVVTEVKKLEFATKFVYRYYKPTLKR